MIDLIAQYLTSREALYRDYDINDVRVMLRDRIVSCKSDKYFESLDLYYETTLKMIKDGIG